MHGMIIHVELSRGVARLQPHDLKALEQLQVSRFKPSARISQQPRPLSWGRMQHTKLRCAWSILMRDSFIRDSCVEKHASHGQHASQCVGAVATGHVTHKQRRRLLRKATNTRHMCEITAAHFNRHKTPRRHFVLDGITRAIIATQSHNKLCN